MSVCRALRICLADFEAVSLWLHSFPLVAAPPLFDVPTVSTKININRRKGEKKL
jgi:hypothetical protein